MGPPGPPCASETRQPPGSVSGPPGEPGLKGEKVTSERVAYQLASPVERRDERVCETERDSPRFTCSLILSRLGLE